MCTVILPPGDNPIAVNKYIISYHIISYLRLCISSVLVNGVVNCYSSGPRRGHEAGSCERGNEHSDSIKYAIFLDYLSN